ncbi:MAG TPA: glutamine amidotransferase [Acidimicrobiia bacterium]|nr:glutamine amidotransferase [Acidimicrobiia bacterium]
MAEPDRSSAVRVALLYPELLGTYGDRGNARVLVQRLAWRGVPAELVEAPWGEPAPASCDIYVLGGGEDSPQASAAAALIAEGVVNRAVDDGAAVLGVCAGFQILGHSFFGPGGAARPGLGLLDCTTARRASPRIVGEILVEPNPEVGLPALSGYENHAGLTDLGPRAVPLGRVDVGVGNGDGTEGALEGRVVGTYLHGPVLARNPALADLILSWFAGELEALDDSEVADLREERRAFVAAEAARRAGRRKRGASPFGWRGYRRRRMSSTARPSPANFSV